MLLILLLILSIIIIYLKVIKPYSTWSKRGIKQTNPIYLFGDSAGITFGRQTFYDSIKMLYNSFPKERYFGMYQMTVPKLMIRDPELIKTLAIKDFDHFVNRHQFIPEGVEPIWTRNLVFMKDKEWKQARMTLSPTFTSSKLKGTFNLICDACNAYVKHFQKDDSMKSVELKDLTSRYTTDVIASVAFGIKCDSINDENNEIFTMAKDINNITTTRLVITFIYSVFPALCKALRVPFFSRQATKYFADTIKDTVRLRRQKRAIIRPDMIHLLMETQKGKMINSSNFKLSDDDIGGHAFLFYLAGFETVAATLYFMGHSLATHPDVQKRLQKEIDQTMENCEGKLTYESLMNMKYLDMVTLETLRKWPSPPVANRLCSKPYMLPPSNDNGKPQLISPGENVLFPTVALHYDPKYFPNPELFDPERFNDENKSKINPYVYIPFGVGPRKCVGSRLALLEVKIFYFYFLLNFDFVQTERTEVPLILKKRSFITATEHDIWVAIKPRIK